MRNKYHNAGHPFAEGFRTAVGIARNISIHWTEEERTAHLKRAVYAQECLKREQPENTNEIAHGAGTIAGYRSSRTAPRAGRHNWKSRTPGANCQECGYDKDGWGL